jgi:predicted RNA-binding Zn-ribbon protein involved in translation (DUF1610 family)
LRAVGETPDIPGSARTDAVDASDEAEESFRCDFCGEQVSRVRRVALDRDYDRLQKPHRVRYACPACSERKERERAGPA